MKDLENFGHQVFQEMSPAGPRDTKGEIYSRHHGEHCNVDLLFRIVHSTNQLCVYGAVTKWCGNKPRSNSGEAIQSRPESARRKPREIQIKQEDLKSLVDTPRLPQASGNRMLQNLKDFKSDAIHEQNWIYPHSSWSFQQRCRRSIINYRYQEMKESTWSNSLETWTRCSVLDSLVHGTRCWSRILADRF